MANELFGGGYNPDILTCLANLSNDEVFTPPDVANKMLDMLPAELWRDPNATFLDPACKSGVFLREIAKRLIDGLADVIPDRQQRVDHIFHTQLYGIAITELTSLLSRRSLYCSKFPNSRYSISHFDNSSGNIRFIRTHHSWLNGRCSMCGASQSEYAGRDGLETHAYELIHSGMPERIFNVKFDVIIGNPPYQLSDGGFGISAMPIYDKFITQSKKLHPRYLAMIVPARWYAGGKGLDVFRDEMLHDNRIRAIHDFPEAADCFPGVQIKGGVCYFLWDRDNRGDCVVTTHRGEKTNTPVARRLLEDGCDSFIRYNEAIVILSKVRSFCEPSMETFVSSRQPFGLPTTFRGDKERRKGDIRLFENGGQSFVTRAKLTKSADAIDRHKVYIPRAGSGSDAFPHPILGKPFIGEPGTACSETYIFIGPYSSKEECQHVISYISTRLFRFLAMLKKVTQSTTRSIYTYVPVQDFTKPWTDKELYAKYGLTDEEIAFIESMIRPMDVGSDANADDTVDAGGDSDAD